jgi:hypothetical protein
MGLRNPRARACTHSISTVASSIRSSRVANRNHALNDKINYDIDWLVDGHGRLRMVMTDYHGKRQLEYGVGDGTSSRWRMSPSTAAMIPVTMSFEGDLLYALSDEDRAQRDLVAIDPHQNRIIRTLFSKPGVDVDGALFDDHRNPSA